MKTLIQSLATVTASFVIVLLFGSMVIGQDVAYCKHAQTGSVIVIEAGNACPMGYFKIN